MLLDQLDSGDEEEEEEEEVDVEELSRKIATLEVMNDLDDSEDDWNDIPGTNENEKIVEEEEKVVIEEEQEEDNEMVVEVVENEVVREVMEEGAFEIATETPAISQIESNQEKVGLPSNITPSPTPTPTLRLADLFSSTVSLTRSPSLVPDELNTRMFMLSQQLSSDTPGKYMRW